MQKGTVLVLGAGATLGGGFKLRIDDTTFRTPLDRDFFETPAVQYVFNEDRYPALAHYRQIASLEDTWAKVDLNLKLCLTRIISEEATYATVAGALQRRANDDQAYRMKMEREPCYSRVPSMAEWELRGLVRDVFRGLHHPRPQESPLYALLDRLRKEHLIAGVISFNYDTSLEQLPLDMLYYPLLPGQDASGKLPLFKLHGSLNWQTDSRCEPNITVVNPPTNIAGMDHGDRWYRQPEMVGPTFFKQEITFDIQDDFRTRHYRSLWHNAWDLLRNARYLVFVGFSFPKTDFHAAALFRTAHLSGAGVHRVILCHQNDRNLGGTSEQVFAGRRTVFTEFRQGLGDMAGRLDELIALLQN